jgi:hypothetical protein
MFFFLTVFSVPKNKDRKSFHLWSQMTLIINIDTKVAVGTTVSVPDDTEKYYLIPRWRPGPQARSQTTTDPISSVYIIPLIIKRGVKLILV